MLKQNFTNRLGDHWCLSFNDLNQTCALSGSDVGWQSYPVVDGHAIGLVLDKDEQKWLDTCWAMLAEKQPKLTLYAGIPTEFRANAWGCHLANNICPLCLSAKNAMEFHHCIAKVEGGSDQGKNLLKICKTCHVIITNGSEEDRLPREWAAQYHQIMYFGLAFFPRKAHPSRSGNSSCYLESRPESRELLRTLGSGSKSEYVRATALLKRLARAEYQYCRDVGLGKWSWSDIEKRMSPRRLG